MGRNVWFPVVSGPLAPFAAGFESWLTSRAYSPSAAADRLYQFDQLSRWLEREGLCVGELTRLLGRRDHAILLLLVRLGLRAGEVASIQLDDIDWRAGLLLVRGKGSRHDELPLPVDVGEAIVSYLRRRPRCECRALFLRVTAPRQGMNRSTVGWVVRAACDRAGLPRVGAHRLRHTAATEMLRAGSLAEIGQVLRHREQKTTAIYAKVDRKALRPLARS
jgi:integrase